ncbi:coenzyme Q biosynthesis Coq4 family protein [Actinidia rufa]|uniref:Coenzyme Q biosynthesis Coq4 family protein n=1 Tax=Actinidia rufa TaxID=165716 RepID=A0A7J0GJD2_9ERIC|nr:coenzyme Q biosynthesis Coq4 family protein [Actinidia rufa]
MFRQFFIFQQSVLLKRPCVVSSKVGHAWDLPDNTFGAAYARFMGSRNFSPNDRPPVRFMEADDLAYVAMRARGTARFNGKQRALFYQHYFPWAIRAGMRRSTDLISIYYEHHFHKDLKDVRRRWGIIPAPPPPREF